VRASRGRGLLLAIDLRGEIGPAVVAEALRRGLLINAARPDSLRFMPALTVTHDEIDEMVSILDATLKQTTGARLA
jgi:acetylornithine/N-succinyldiaminopimelate aminotransferase